MDTVISTGFGHRFDTNRNGLQCARDNIGVNKTRKHYHRIRLLTADRTLDTWTHFQAGTGNRGSLDTGQICKQTNRTTNVSVKNNRGGFTLFSSVCALNTAHKIARYVLKMSVCSIDLLCKSRRRYENYILLYVHNSWHFQVSVYLINGTFNETAKQQ